MHGKNVPCAFFHVHYMYMYMFTWQWLCAIRKITILSIKLISKQRCLVISKRVIQKLNLYTFNLKNGNVQFLISGFEEKNTGETRSLYCRKTSLSLVPGKGIHFTPKTTECNFIVLDIDTKRTRRKNIASHQKEWAYLFWGENEFGKEIPKWC